VLSVDSSDTSLSRLSLLDWIGVLVVATSGLFGMAVPLVIAPMFRQLGESLGVPASSLPTAVLQGWVPVLLGLLPLALLLYGLVVRQGVGRRRLFLVLAFLLTIVESVVFLFALYGTLFAAAAAPGGP
jgi:hypothetical protein